MATKVIAWETGSGNITLTYQGQGDGPLTVVSDDNDIGTARSQVITVETVDGAVVKNLTVSQSACPFPVGDVKNFPYTGGYQDVELPAGQYKLQCWGAQGGSNAAASSYGITAKAGGKGGYSEGIITLIQKTTVRVTVGGAGSSSAAGFNGGGSTTGSASYNSGNEQGVSRMGGGGGASDIRLSDGALLSRMIVAGGGAGGAMCFKKVTTSSTVYTNVYSGEYSSWWMNAAKDSRHVQLSSSEVSTGKTYRLVVSGSVPTSGWQIQYFSGTTYKSLTHISPNSDFTTPTSGFDNAYLCNYTANEDQYSGNVKLQRKDTSSSTTTYNESQVGGVGGGTQGGAYSSTYAGKQNVAGSGGSFGQGANQTVTNYRYCSGAGGGGWYGGGTTYSDNSMTSCKYGGGGSGFVNTAESAANRPSGYTGLELDSGTTIDGAHSFEAPGGGTEIGHSGNGYIRITRLA